MGISADIKTLGEDIVASYDTRVKAIGTLVKGTHQMLKGFDAEHKEMADNLKESLEKGETDRLRDFKAMMGNIQKGIKDIGNYVAKTLKEFSDAHAEMSEQQKKDLASGETDRLKDFKAMMGNIRKGIKDIANYVAKKLKEFSDAHADMSEELKKELAKYVDDMVKATEKLMDDIQKRQKERNAQVADLLEAYKTEREKMAANWQSLTVTMTKRRGKPIVVMPRIEARKGGAVMPRIEAGEKVAKFRKGGVIVMPKIEAGEKVTTVKEAVKKPKQKGGKKGKGKKKKVSENIW